MDMKKTELVRGCADAMHVAEDGLEATLAAARTALESLKATKAGLGLTGTMGDAAIARWTESVQALEEACEAMRLSHGEAYRVVKTVNIRGTAIGPINDTRGFAAPEERNVA
jgi:hypothetical protein